LLSDIFNLLRVLQSSALHTKAFENVKNITCYDTSIASYV